MEQAEKFKTDWGTIFKRPSDIIKVGDIVGIVGNENNIEITGCVVGVEEMADEELIERFEEILNLKGRIVFKPEQSPSYPTAGNDPGPDIKHR